MTDYFFIETADSKLSSEIARLYCEAGWWPEAQKNLEVVRDIVVGSHCFMVVLVDSSVVGMGRAISDGVSDAYIQDIAVLKDWRGRGIARGIVSKIIRSLKGDGIDWIGLVAERGTHQLYEDLGFQQISDSKALLLKDEPDGFPKT